MESVHMCMSCLVFLSTVVVLFHLVLRRLIVSPPAKSFSLSFFSPHRLFGVFLAFTSVFLSLASVWSCRFFEYQTTDGVQQAGGLYRISYRHDECIIYEDLPKNAMVNQDGNDFRMDASFKASRVFGAMAIVLGFILAVTLIPLRWRLSPTANSAHPQRQWRIMACAFLLAGIFQTLTFLVYIQVVDGTQCRNDNYDSRCDLGWGAILSVVAAVLYLLIGTSMLTNLFRCPTSPEDYSSPFLVRLVEALVARLGITTKTRGFLPITRQLLTSHSGYAQVAALILTAITFVLTIAVVVDCKFYETNFDDRGWNVGLFGYYYTPESACRSWEYGSMRAFPASAKAAQAFGVLACVFGGILLLLLVTMTFFWNYPLPYYKMLPWLSVLAGTCQPLTFLMFVEANNRLCQLDGISCGIGNDGVAAIVATLLYFILTVLIVCARLGPDDTSDSDLDFDKDGIVAELKGDTNLKNPDDHPSHAGRDSPTTTDNYAHGEHLDHFHDEDNHGVVALEA